MNEDTWVVMPVFEEAEVVRSVTRDLRRSFANVVAVDDGSRDDSAAEAEAGGALVVRHPINLGQGAALQTGIELALRDTRCAHLVTFDADGQHLVSDAVRMVERLREGDHDIVIGSRFLGSAVGIPTSRRLLLLMGARVMRLTSGVRLTDPYNGLRAFTRPFAEAIDITLSNMAHTAEFTSLIARLGARYEEVPVTIIYTDYSRQKGQRSINSVNLAVDLSMHHLFRRRAR